MPGLKAKPRRIADLALRSWQMLGAGGHQGRPPAGSIFLFELDLCDQPTGECRIQGLSGTIGEITTNGNTSTNYAIGVTNPS